MRKAIYIAFFLIITPGIFAKCPDFFIEFNGNAMTFDYLNINGTCYIAISELSELLRNASPADKVKLKAHPESFFSLIETDENMYIVQMNVPTVAYGSTVFLPGKSFFKSLEALQAMDIRIAGEIIKIGRDSKQKSPMQSSTPPLMKSRDKLLKATNANTLDEDRIYDSMVETMRKLREHMNSPESIRSENSDTIDINYVDSLEKRPPSQYSIPGKLKK